MTKSPLPLPNAERCVGQVDTEQEPTQVVNHDRRNMVDVKSIAI